jgi:hypothetical protein
MSCQLAALFLWNIKPHIDRQGIKFVEKLNAQNPSPEKLMVEVA